MKGILLAIGRYLHQKLAFETVVVIGDSHAQVFGHDLFRFYFPRIKFDVCSVGGATVSGLDNPNSKTDAYGVFKRKLESTAPRSRIIIMLGEVDTGFVIWFQAEKYRNSVEATMKKAVVKYTAFIDELTNHYEPIVISTPLPTIADGSNWGEVANLRREVTARQVDRTDLTLKFNGAVRSYCLAHAITYIDLDSESLGKDGLVKPSLLNGDKRNHHYDGKRHVQLIAPKLRTLFQSQSQ